MDLDCCNFLSFDIEKNIRLEYIILIEPIWAFLLNGFIVQKLTSPDRVTEFSVPT